MKPNELKIGNYVYFKHCDYDKNLPRVIDYTSKPNLLGLEGVSVNRIEYNNIEPIPLTEEWLLRFGIGKQNSYPYKFLNGYLKLRNGNYFFKYYDIEIELPYVHSLQNLFHVLKNEELCLKD